MRSKLPTSLWVGGLLLAAGAVVAVAILSWRPRARSAENALTAPVAQVAIAPSPALVAQIDSDSHEAIEQHTLAPSERVPLAPATSTKVALETATSNDARATLVVLVVAADDGRPLAGVRVEIRGKTQKTHTSDAAGRIELRARPGVAHRLEVGAVGNEEILVEPLESGESREVVLRVPARDLLGRVLARETGMPIADARLALASSPKGAWHAELVSDERGAFRTRTPSSPIELVAAAQGYARCVTLVGARNEAVVLLSRAPKLVVRAVNEAGRPLPRALVKLTGPVDAHLRPTVEWEGPCDANGAFEVADALVGTPLHLVVESEDRRVEQTIAALVPGEHREVVAELEPQVVVTGILRDASAKPIGCDLWMIEAYPDSAERYFGPEDQPAHTTTSHEDGRFRIEHVRPGTWWIGPGWNESFATGLGYLGSGEDAPPPWAQLVAIPAGETQAELQLVAAFDLVVGCVTGSAPLTAIRVTARPLAGTGHVGVLCDENGAFTLALAPGPHELIAHHPHYGASPPQYASGGEQGLVLELHGTVLVRGRVLGTNGASGNVRYSPVDALDVSSAEMSTEGDFELGPLAPGRYRLAAITDDDRIGCADLEVGAESSAHIEIALGATGEIVVHWNSNTDSGLALSWEGIDLSTWHGDARTPSPARLRAPIGLPLDLTVLRTQRHLTLTVPDGGKLELDLTTP